MSALFCRRFSATLFAAAAFALAAAAAAERPTLAEMVALAEEYHADFLARRADLEAQAEGENIARADLLPQVSAQIREDLKRRESDNRFLDITATQPLVNFSAASAWRAAADETELSRINLQAARHALRRDVVLAWLDAHLAADVLSLVEARRRTLREQEKRVRVLAKAGRVTRADVLAATANVAGAEAQWRQAQHDLSAAHDAFLRYTGVGAGDARLSLAAAGLPALPPLPAWLRRVADKSLSLAAGRQQIVYLRRLLSAAKTAAIPNVDLRVGARTGGNVGDAETRAEVLLSQRLFTGGNITAQQRRILAQLRAARSRLIDVGRAEEQEARRLHGQMRAHRERMVALREAAEAAEALLAAVIAGYNNGVRIAEEVTSAEEDVFSAKLELRRAAYDYLKSWVRLKSLAAESDDDFIAVVEGFFTPRDGGAGEAREGE